MSLLKSNTPYAYTSSLSNQTPTQMQNVNTNPTFYGNGVSERAREWAELAPFRYAAGSTCSSTGVGATTAFGAGCPTSASVQAANKTAPKGQQQSVGLQISSHGQKMNVLRGDVGAGHVSRLAAFAALGADTTGSNHGIATNVILPSDFATRNALERGGALLNVNNGSCDDNGYCNWTYNHVGDHIAKQQRQHPSIPGVPPTKHPKQDHPHHAHSRNGRKGATNTHRATRSAHSTH